MATTPHGALAKAVQLALPDKVALLPEPLCRILRPLSTSEPIGKA